MEFQEIQLPSTSETAGEMIYGLLKEEILSGQLSSQTILKEVTVAERFNASRTPVREALHRLTSDLLLEVVPRKGYRIRELMDQDILHMYDAAIALEGMTACLCAQKHTWEHIEKLREVLEESARIPSVSEESLRVQSKLNYEFHITIAETTGNLYLLRGVQMVQEKLLMHTAYSISHYSFIENQDHWKFETHDRILEAIEFRDAEVAKLLMEKHFIKAKEAFRTFMDMRHKTSMRINPSVLIT